MMLVISPAHQIPDQPTHLNFIKLPASPSRYTERKRYRPHTERFLVSYQPTSENKFISRLRLLFGLEYPRII